MVEQYDFVNVQILFFLKSLDLKLFFFFFFTAFV